MKTDHPVTEQLRPRKRRKPPSDHRKAMQCAYNEIYRMNQKNRGVPTRREVSEFIMQTVIRNLPRPEASEILRSAGLSLQKVRNRDGTPRYTKPGILHRWESLVAELAMIKSQ